MQFERTDDLKSDILRLFDILVREHGYDGTTFQMISDILGITKGAITYHYKNKHHIVGILIENFFQAIRDFIDSYPEAYQNQYWRTCITYICAYRTILNAPQNERLFFHRDQMVLWESTKVTTVYGIYKNITNDFHKIFDDEELQSAVYIDLGARHRMYEEYSRGNPLFTLDKFCYQHVYLIGCLCRLDEVTIKENIRLAFEFADAHPHPVTSTFR